MNKDNFLKLKDCLIEINGEYINTDLLNNTFDYREMKAIIFIDEDSFKNKKLDLKFKKSIKIKLKEDKYNIGDKIILKLTNNIGKGIIKEKYAVENNTKHVYEIEPIAVYIDKKYETSLFKLFRLLTNKGILYDYNEENDELNQKLEKLINSNFKIYYYGLIERCKNICGKNKYASIAAYASLKKYINDLNKYNKEKTYISPPNCYIKGSKVEYDALLIKTPDSKYLYDKKEVLAIIEIKTGGIICKNTEIKETYNEIVERGKYENIPFKYIAFHEFKEDFEKYKMSRENVTQTFLTLKDKSKKIDCNEKSSNEQFILPENFSIDNLF